MIELNDSINQSWPDQTFHEIYFRNLFLFPDGIQLLDSSLIHHSFKGEYYMLNLDLEQQKFLVSNYQLKIKNSSFVSNFNKPKVYSLSKYEEPYSFICYSKGDTLNIYCLDLNIRVFCSMKSIDPDDFIRELIHGDESRFDFWAL